MSGVLHPAGPEPAQTYWLRRVLVLLALVVVVLVSVALVASASMGATRSQPPPAGAAVPTAAPTPTDSLGPTDSLSSATPSAPSEPTSSTATSPPPRGGAAEVTPACDRADLKTTVSGKQMLKLSKPAAFTISVRNDSDETCRLSLTGADFELSITAGKKVLWSSRACSTATFVVAAKLELDQVMTWSILWDGRGVAAGCKQPGPELQRGTFRATAQVTGAKPAVLPVTLRP